MTGLSSLTDRQVSIVSIKLILIGILYPGWSILLLLALPEAYNSIIGRSLVGLFAFVCLIGIRKSDRLAKRANDLLHIVIFVMTVHFISLVYLSGFTYVYVVGMLVYTTAVSPILESLRSQMAYCALYLVGTAIACAVGSPPWETTVMLMAGLVTLAVVFCVVLYSKGRLEEELADSQEQLLAARHMASIGHFAKGVAHEINNPLTVIIGQAEIMTHAVGTMEQQGSEVKYRVLRSAEKIHHMAKRAANIASSMLTFANMAKDEVRGEMDPGSVVAQVKEKFAKEFEEFNISFSSSLNFNKGRFLCSEGDVVRALSILVQNAVEAVSGLATREISIEVTGVKDFLTFKVRDSGPGPAPGIRDKMMTPFFTTKSVGAGEGLGLAVAYGLAVKHRGSLYFDDSEKASTFVLTFRSFS